MDAEDILSFWFVDHGPHEWWRVNPAFDAEIKTRFGALYDQAARGELFCWRETARGALAEIIILDQFTRQLNRDKAEAFGNDKMALALAQTLIAGGNDAHLGTDERKFAYMPYMHAESLLIQTESLRLFKTFEDETESQTAQNHYDVIARFGRFPLRNHALGRPSTQEEERYINERGSNMY